ncbi:hypothetical protein [Oscillatoria acuminata]|uniref:Uncharacterized protein n=1 Tax=Oscillatoria acuminata PCC 6304 TaxID=56110 RepID=K9TNP5_9CYAN|nr:hypothetical protein [Oscillatoria acuminata]AFY83639.1 hypothetical protein Oscil6304_4110 [Oscillatoria acuminata PCC 6304]
MRYLSAENAATASINLYRKRFKTYFKISLVSHLWLLIPVYGWAKFYAGIALMSRLAFSEINGKTETINEAQTHINPRIWKFLVAAILASLGFAYRAFFWVLLWSICVGIISSLLVLVFSSLLALNYGLMALFGLLFLVVILCIYAWFFLKMIEIYSPFFIYEIPLAIEEEMTSSTTITRSRQLVEGLRRSVVKTIMIPFIATLPISILSILLWFLIVGLIQEGTSTTSEESTYSVIEQVVWVIYWGSFNILLTPFWQVLKSIAYYNLRCQKEAFDLPITLSSPALSDDAGDFMGLGSES